MTELPLEISCQTVKAMLDRGDDFVLVDCRESDEYAVARIEAARLVPMSEIQERLPELESDRSRQIVVHCHHGGRSLRVAQYLRKNGFAGAQSMSGGIDEWSTAIDPSVARY
ncbi:MAG TPA: rhodanese-like domain-containing protein [Pirellulales bacterium]|nr:rhodanese-like domain-containing protein [Pirellulales bacterium]